MFKDQRNQLLLLITIAVISTIAIAMMNANRGASTEAIAMMLFGVLMLIIIGLIVAKMGIKSTPDVIKKKKRTRRDYYHVIDQLVDQLDEDDVAYLEHHLEAFTGELSHESPQVDKPKKRLL